MSGQRDILDAELVTGDTLLYVAIPNLLSHVPY